MEKQIGEFSHVHVTEKKWKRKFGFSVPMSIKKTFEIYDDCLFLIMLACPNEQFIKYIVGFSCILVFFFYEFTLYPVSDSASTKNFASQQHIPTDVDGYKFKTTCRLNVLSQLSLINLLI